jgi:hypothetical protein
MENEQLKPATGRKHSPSVQNSWTIASGILSERSNNMIIVCSDCASQEIEIKVYVIEDVCTWVNPNELTPIMDIVFATIENEDNDRDCWCSQCGEETTYMHKE